MCWTPLTNLKCAKSRDFIVKEGSISLKKQNQRATQKGRDAMDPDMVIII